MTNREKKKKIAIMTNREKKKIAQGTNLRATGRQGRVFFGVWPLNETTTRLSGENKSRILKMQTKKNRLVDTYLILPDV